MRLVLTCALAWSLTSSVEASEVSEANGRRRPAFTKKPAAAKNGEKTTITFAVDRETDVAVFIDDANGKVVRHLAAGVLGPNPPPPFKAGLAQEIVWDGKADYGKPAENGPFKVRVALGLGAKCDKIFSRPEKFSGQCTLGMGPDGALYVRESACPAGYGFSKSRLAVLNRDGSYRRTLLPFPSTPGGEAGRGMPNTIALQGRPAPVYEVEFDLMPWLASSPTATVAVSTDGRTLYLPVSGGNPFRPAEIWLLSTEGGGISGRHQLDKNKVGELPEFGERSHMAVSSDGKSLFLLGLRDRRGKGEPSAVYRVRLPDFSGLDVFFGERGVPGKDATHLGAVAGGLASDGKGNLLICDTANNRVVAVGEEDGKFRGEIACDSPWNVGVHRASGAVYVASQGRGGARLTKFSGWKDARKICELPLPAKGTAAGSVNMVVDGAAERAVVWVATTRVGYIVRAEDQGDKFGVTETGGPFEALPGPRHEMGYLGLSVDRTTREVYVRNCGTGENWERFDESGRSEFVRPAGIEVSSQLMPGPDGFLYAIWYRHGFAKFDRSGKRLAWEDPRIPTEEEIKVYGNEKVPPAGPSTLSFARVGMVFQPHTLGVRWSDGHLFVLEPHMITGGDGGRVPKALHEYLPTGKRITTVDQPIIWKVSDPAVGPKFDAAGNIYIAEIVRPKGWKYPSELKAHFEGGKGQALQDSANATAKMYGSIVKFTPKGGMIHDWKEPVVEGPNPFTGQPRLDPGLKPMEVDYFRSSALFPVKITGAEWVHPGVGHIGLYACNCENITFDVDEFGRVFFPDPCLYQVRVIDTAGNAITTIGGYGNADNCGPESAVIDPKTGQPRPRRADDPRDLKSPFAEPDIAMSSPVGVGTTDRHLYVADALNRRVLRGKLEYAATETVAVP